MTQPRRLTPGATYMVTRRTLRRTCLLRPDTEVSELYRYCLCVTAARYGIVVHAVVLMSTHEHLVVTDPHAHLPLFLRELHRLVALGVKALRAWEGAVWDHEPTSVVQLLTPEAIVEKIAYVIANPVAAGLVRCADEWPGPITLPRQLGRTVWSANRPKAYFGQDDSVWPARASLELTLPATLETPAEDLRATIAELVADAERDARAEMKSKGWSFLGSRRVTRASPYNRARSWEPLRARNPTFAVGRGQQATFFDAVRRLRDFRRDYRSALAHWLSGIRDVIFPYGTWAMQWLHHAAVALPG